METPNAPTSPPTGSASSGSPSSSRTGLPPSLASALAYLCFALTGLVFLAIEKDNREVRYHAWQSIFLGVAVILLQIAIWILAALFGSLTAVLGAFVSVIGGLLNLGVVVLWVVCMVKAYRTEHFKLPVIGDLAEAQS